MRNISPKKSLKYPPSILNIFYQNNHKSVSDCYFRSVYDGELTNVKQDGQYQYARSTILSCKTVHISSRNSLYRLSRKTISQRRNHHSSMPASNISSPVFFLVDSFTLILMPSVISSSLFTYFIIM